MQQRLIAVFLVFLSVFAFAGGESESSSADSEKIELSFLHFKTGSEAGALPDILERFHAENPNINITVEAIATSNGYSDALKTRLVAELPTDIFMINHADYGNFVRAGYLADLTETDAVQSTLPTIRDQFAVGGRIYASTLTTDAMGMYANMEILADAGVNELPKDWNEFLSACEKVKKAGYLPWVMGNKVNSWSTFHSFENAIYAENTPVTELDAAIIDGKVSIASLWEPQLKRIQVLIDNDYINTTESMGMVWNQECFTSFVNGGGAFMFGGSWQISQINETGVDTEFKFFPTPLVEGTAAKAHLMASLPLAVNARTEYPEAAMLLYEYLFKPENINEFVISQSGFAPIKGGKSSADPIGIPLAEAVSMGDTVLWPTEYRNIGHINDWRQSLSELILGLRTPEEMAKKFEDQFKKKLELSK